jgi:hypothetical protein
MSTGYVRTLDLVLASTDLGYTRLQICTSAFRLKANPKNVSHASLQQRD